MHQGRHPSLGPAVLQAAAEARQKLFEIAAPLLETGVEELRSQNGKIYPASDPSKLMPFREACHKIDPDNPIRGSGSRASNPNAPMFSTFGAQAVELEVDIETGLVDILKITAAHDFGRAINPKLCISQIYGGIGFGIGYALSEEGIYDPRTGKLLSTNLHQYKMPSSLDVPAIHAILTEDEDPYFAYFRERGR